MLLVHYKYTRLAFLILSSHCIVVYKDSLRLIYCNASKPGARWGIIWWIWITIEFNVFADRHDLLEEEHRELRTKYYALKNEHDELMDKMKYFSKVLTNLLYSSSDTTIGHMQPSFAQPKWIWYVTLLCVCVIYVLEGFNIICILNNHRKAVVKVCVRQLDIHTNYFPFLTVDVVAGGQWWDHFS